MPLPCLRPRGPAALLLVAPLLLVPLLLLSGCGTGETGVPASQAAPLGGAGSGAAGSHAGHQGLGTAITPLGTVVTSDGYTLYRFQKDSAKPSASRCEGACAKTWPPVLGDGVPVVDGVDPTLVGTVGRSDGAQQLTLNGWPLYRFAKDSVPGEVKGDGVGGTWKAIAPDGKPVPGPAPAAAAPPAAPAAPGSAAPASSGY